MSENLHLKEGIIIMQLVILGVYCLISFFNLFFMMPITKLWVIITLGVIGTSAWVILGMK